MQFFVDSAEISEIRQLSEINLVDGVTTNPSLIKASGADFKSVISEICAIITGPVSAEVIATDYETMVEEGLRLRELAENVVVKLPLTLEGLRACHELVSRGIQTNVTLCFSANQAILAAKAGATFVSPFIGRLDDINLPGIQLIKDIRTIYDTYGFDTKVLAASIRTANHVSECALSGADVVTVPPKVIHNIAVHPLTEIGLKKFLADAAHANIRV